MAQSYAPIAGTDPGAKQWKNRWFECCGDCDDLGWGICCIGYSVPCVLYGWNRARAFATSGLKWGVLIILPLIVMWICGSASEGVTAASVKCAKDPTACEKIFRSKSYHFSVMEGVLSLITFLAFVGFVALGWWNRYTLRQKYGLPGNHCTDCLLWTFCPTCAICQESRTMESNHVENGVWLGPDVMLVSKSGQTTV